MTDHIEKLLKRFIVDKEHRKYRKEPYDPYEQAAGYSDEGLSDIQRAVRRLKYVLENEKPVVYHDEKIAMIRTVTTVPEIFTREEWDQIRKNHYIHEQGKVCNISPEYALLLNVGFNEKRKEIQDRLSAGSSPEENEFLGSLLETLDIIEAFAQRYRIEAERAGNHEVARIFERIPANKPESFHEALQFLRLIHYCLWCSFNYHNTFGRFDQYMYPYYINDIKEGRLTRESALELIEEFFISCNKDSDLYPGMQQGDNGQSMVLGGLNEDGSDSYNELSDLCLQASLELKLIDPKINLRVNRKTPLSMYEKGTHLTKHGLGFPQYSNDDIIIPALKKWGYDPEDAYNYVVAACWEFIIPGYGMDIPNIGGLSFVKALTDCMDELPDCSDFDTFMDKIKENISKQARELMDCVRNIYMEPAPLMSMLMRGCVENARDVSKGNKYNNYGFHGVGLSTAVDSLAAIEKYVFNEKKISAQELVQMLKENYKGHEEIQHMLRYESPKMGDDDDQVDRIAILLLDWFADSLEEKRNDRNGIFRPGTGSAMYYVWHGENVMATPDGRSFGESLACNYSPSLFARCRGPVSIIKSFSKPNLMRVANGGPLTIELHDSLFRNEDSIQKVAMFIKSYMDMGGHQMQINAVNRDKLMDAKKHPENYRNLIVRVWGWSGYFVELDEVYQDHIIKRAEYTI